MIFIPENSYLDIRRRLVIISAKPKMIIIFKADHQKFFALARNVFYCFSQTGFYFALLLKIYRHIYARNYKWHLLPPPYEFQNFIRGLLFFALVGVACPLNENQRVIFCGLHVVIYIVEKSRRVSIREIIIRPD